VKEEEEEEARNDVNGRRRLRAMGNGEKHIAEQSVVVYNTSRAEEGPKDVIAPSAVYIDICV
jgi:hypothetical protein